MSDSERRDFSRTPFTCSIKVMWNDGSQSVVKTRDISDGGLFLLVDDSDEFDVGAHLKGQVQGMLVEAPVVEMEVVRIEPSGLGLKFLTT